MATGRGIAAGATFDSPAQEAYLNLWRTYDRLREFEDALFGRYGLTAQQYNALRLLRDQAPEGIPTLALAEKLVTRAPDITRLLDRLEDGRLIQRERPEGNRRTVLVSITPMGRKLLEELDAPVRKCHEDQLGHLSLSSMKQLIALLKEARQPHERPNRATQR